MAVRFMAAHAASVPRGTQEVVVVRSCNMPASFHPPFATASGEGWGPGTIVGGDFRMLRVVRSGGMGAVYAALQLSTGKERAIKVMHPDLVADPRLRERFEQEARVGALIDSDHVVEVIAAGVDAGTGVPWIAMELLEGQDLADYVSDRGCLSLAETAEVLRQMCHALAAAHAAGVVHRDLKPDNVFVARVRSVSAPTSIKILDFGIAKVAAQAKTTVTAMVGSPAWMAPEQTDPRAVITPATDVWAVGLMTFWLLTGKPFWQTALDPASSMHALMRELLFQPIQPASARAAELGLGARLPPGFDAWFARCVSREPQDRFASAAELAAAFAAVVAAAGPEHQLPPPSSSSSFARAATVPLSSRIDPAAPLAPPRARVVRTEHASPLDLAHAREAVSAPPPRSLTGAPTVRDSEPPPAERVPRPRFRATSRRVVGVAMFAIAGAIAGFYVTRSPEEQPAMTPAATSTPAPVASSATSDTVDSAAIPAPSVVPEAHVRPTPIPRASTASSTARAAPDPSAAPATSSSAEAAAVFDAVVARQRLDGQAHVAKQLCHDRPGKRGMVVDVSWRNDGGVKNVLVDGGFANGDEAAFCVQGQFWAVRVDAYSGPEQTLSTGVSLD
jgi:eukaryotic-like serine/threonine-protein kinase